MRKKLITITLMVIILYLITSCTKPKSKIEVYSFNGEDENIAINKGLIIITDDLEKFIGGDLLFKNEEQSYIKDYFMKFFYYKDGNEEVILNETSTVKDAVKSVHITSELGSVSSKKLFYDDLDLIKKSLSFSLSGKVVVNV